MKLARENLVEAIKVFVDLMVNGKTEKIKMEAAREIADRVMGKTTATVRLQDDPDAPAGTGMASAFREALMAVFERQNGSTGGSGGA